MPPSLCTSSPMLIMDTRLPAALTRCSISETSQSLAAELPVDLPPPRRTHDNPMNHPRSIAR